MDDLQIVGGRIFDPARGVDRVCDLAVTAGRISAVGDVQGAGAHRTIDARGLLVVPGLVDLHTHLMAGGSFWGLDPDPIAWHTGVTTWVDAGSAGAFTVESFLADLRRHAIRSAILLHVSGHGLSARTGESRDLAFLDVDSAVRAICANREVICGVKVRMDSTTVGPNRLEPLRLAIEVGSRAGVPVMVHIGSGPFGLNEVVDLLRPGDIVTHCAGRGAIGITRPGAIRDSLRSAYGRGVIFDIGHGAGGFSFEVLDAYLDQGMPPHVVSTDLHLLSAPGPAFDLPTVMSKLTASGMTLADVVVAVTAAPAHALGLSSGTLQMGAPADIGIFRISDAPTTVGDVHGVTRISHQTLVNVGTYVAGRLLPPAFPQEPPEWVPLSTGQRAALAARADRLRAMLSEPLVAPDEVQNQIPSSR